MVLQATDKGKDADVQQLKLEVAGYQTCCKELGDDLAAKDRELEGQSTPCKLSWWFCSCSVADL